MSSFYWMLDRILHNGEKKLKIVAEYEEWLKKARPKDSFVYFKGLSPMQTFVGQVIKTKVYTDYERGLVHVVTRRKGSFNFDYIAVRSSKKVEDAHG